MITIKEYAERKGVSHQSVYKQLQTHADELAEFIVTKGRTRYLTDEAIGILEQYRETNPQVVEKTNYQEKIEDLEREIEIMRKNQLILEHEKAALSMELKEAYKEKAEQAKLIADAEANKLLIEQKDMAYDQLQQEFQKRNDKIDELQAVIRNQEAKSVFQLISERLFGKKE